MFITSHLEGVQYLCNLFLSFSLGLLYGVSANEAYLIGDIYHISIKYMISKVYVSYTYDICCSSCPKDFVLFLANIANRLYIMYMCLCVCVYIHPILIIIIINYNNYNVTRDKEDAVNVYDAPLQTMHW